MPPAFAHADYSRPRLLRLLDELDALPQTGAATLAIVADSGDTPPLPGLPGDVAEPLLDHARRAETGAFLFAAPDRAIVVAPPFPVEAPFRAAGYQTGPLRSLLTARRAVGVVLLRYGGWAVGVYDGETLIDGRNGGRFVKNRHRKGGQSQRRFERIREKQIDELFDQACAAAAALLRPHTLDWLVHGGDRHTVQAFRKRCDALDRLPAPLLPRFLTVPEPRHATLAALPALLTASRVTLWRAAEGAPPSSPVPPRESKGG